MSVTKRRIILDVDVGTDDAFALLVLLDAEKKGLVKIEAIVCSNGNASLEDVCRNVVRLLELLDRTDIPVYKGAVKGLIPWKKPIQQYHGKDGFGDIEHEKEPNVGIIKKTPAAIAVHDIIVKNPKEITIVALGPVTNIALALKLFDDFATNVKEVFIMGGNHLGIGNASAAGEFNFYADPESAYIVLDLMRCQITALPWEPCRFTEMTLDWRFNVLGIYQTPFIELLNRAEKNLHGHKPLDAKWYGCDCSLAICMLYPESILEQVLYNATVELNGSETRGQVVIRRAADEDYNIHFIEKIDYDVIKNVLIDVVKNN